MLVSAATHQSIMLSAALSLNILNKTFPLVWSIQSIGVLLICSVVLGGVLFCSVNGIWDMLPGTENPQSGCSLKGRVVFLFQLLPTVWCLTLEIAES